MKRWVGRAGAARLPVWAALGPGVWEPLPEPAGQGPARPRVGAPWGGGVCMRGAVPVGVGLPQGSGALGGKSMVSATRQSSVSSSAGLTEQHWDLYLVVFVSGSSAVLV